MFPSCLTPSRVHNSINSLNDLFSRHSIFYCFIRFSIVGIVTRRLSQRHENCRRSNTFNRFGNIFRQAQEIRILRWKWWIRLAKRRQERTWVTIFYCLFSRSLSLFCFLIFRFRFNFVRVRRKRNEFRRKKRTTHKIICAILLKRLKTFWKEEITLKRCLIENKALRKSCHFRFYWNSFFLKSVVRHDDDSLWC